MRLLLDTHTFIWAATWPERLSSSMAKLLVDPTVERWVSVIAFSEIAVKVQRGHLNMPLDPAYYEEQILALGARTLPIELRHCFAMFSLPRHHGDPFDRLLIAQAKLDQLTIATQDSAFAAYDVPVLW